MKTTRVKEHQVPRLVIIMLVLLQATLIRPQTRSILYKISTAISSPPKDIAIKIYHLS
jgi:hypothetical protein